MLIHYTKNDPNYKVSYTSKKPYHFNRWKCQNQKGQKEHKITLFQFFCKSSSNWNKVSL